MIYIEKIVPAFKNYFKSIDAFLLIFLILLLNVNLPLKILAATIMFAFRFKVKDAISAFKTGALPGFYLLMILFVFVGFLINFHLWNLNYLILTAFGIGLWFMSVLILSQLKQIVDSLSHTKIHNTLILFFILNASISLLKIVQIILITKNLNPYTYAGMDLKYHASTGDGITGIFFDFSSTNSIINIFGIFYFLYRQNFITSLLCLIVVLITTSNTNIILLLVALIALLIFHKNKFYKIISLCFMGIIVVFFARVSPSNTQYVANLASPKKNAQTADTGLLKPIPTPDEIKHHKAELFQHYYLSKFPSKELLQPRNKSIVKAFEKTSYIEKEIQSAKDPDFTAQMKSKQKILASNTYHFYHDSIVTLEELKHRNLPGKAISILQTLKFSGNSTKHLLVGSGAGLFSSKIAFKASGVGVFGKYPEKLQYVSEDFVKNHLKIFCYFFGLDIGQHSVANTPFSVYNQLLGEYGIIGVIAFLIFYVYFFLKRFKYLTYGRFLLPLCLAFLGLDYWFEHLSIVLVFELLVLIDLKANEKKEVPVKPQASS